MTISQTAEYALRAVVWLSEHPDAPLGTRELSKAVKVPPGYLAKVLQTLARAGIVASTPGRTGGFQLVQDPSRLTILTVINAVDPVQRIHSCPLHLESHSHRLCPLHAQLDKAAEDMEKAFGSVTVAELTQQETTSPPLREFLPGGRRPGI